MRHRGTQPDVDRPKPPTRHKPAPAPKKAPADAAPGHSGPHHEDRAAPRPLEPEEAPEPDTASQAPAEAHAAGPEIVFVDVPRIILTVPGERTQTLALTVMIEVPPESRAQAEALMPRITDSFNEFLSRVDAAAFSLCAENNLRMVVFSMEGQGNITRALLGEKIGTLVSVTGEA